MAIFNDEDRTAIEKLEAEVAKLPGIGQIHYKPIFMNERVDDETAEYFKRGSMFPTLTFIDPFGYVGLTRQLVEGVTKNFGCDCIFFFNYNRVNAALGTPIFHERMAAIFGEARAAALEAKMQSFKGKPHQREGAIVDTLTEALEELNRGDNYVRAFRFIKGNRTSHMLVLVTKHEKGYRVMNDIMAKAGFRDDKGIPYYTHYEDGEPPRSKLFYPEFDALKSMLLSGYAGQTVTMGEIFERHGLRRNYIASNYKDALIELEAEGAVIADPPAKDRPTRSGKATFSDSTRVTFPKRGD